MAMDKDEFWQAVYLAAVRACADEPEKVANKAADDWAEWQSIRDVERALQSDVLSTIATMRRYDGTPAKINMIKALRGAYPMGLKDAKDAVEYFLAEDHWEQWVHDLARKHPNARIPHGFV